MTVHRAVASNARAAGPDLALNDYFRPPARSLHTAAAADLPAVEGYFSFGGAVCYGRTGAASPARYFGPQLPDVDRDVQVRDGKVHLPFDLDDVVTNLRQERYRQQPPHFLEQLTQKGAVRSAYYALRPLLTVPLRRHLQKAGLAGWGRIAFPRWPVDFTVETLMQTATAVVMKNLGIERLPFIWFWPDGAQACLMMTHDIESRAGSGFCDALMDIDDAFGIKSAFHIVPEKHCEVSSGLVERLRRRGFEVNLHDLNHDGRLFSDREQFLIRAAEINRHARALGCRGFRSGAMYREQDWYDAFEFSYDMSVPNTAHLEPQRGGCCTVMPYFVGDVLELPLTTTQDYSLFHILDDYSTALWERQIEQIRSHHGLISFIAHPDYLIDRRARAVYERLLAHLSHIREETSLWTALPGEVDQWWRNRRAMTLAPEGHSWRIEGSGSERARLAYAVLDGDRLVYELAAI